MYFEELERDAEEDTIKTAYRRLAKFYHPDGLLLHFYVSSSFSSIQCVLHVN
jgi:DnaJ-class molecular chaperone